MQRRRGLPGRARRRRSAARHRGHGCRCCRCRCRRARRSLHDWRQQAHDLGLQRGRTGLARNVEAPQRKTHDHCQSPVTGLQPEGRGLRGQHGYGSVASGRCSRSQPKRHHRVERRRPRGLEAGQWTRAPRAELGFRTIGASAGLANDRLRHEHQPPEKRLRAFFARLPRAVCQQSPTLRVRQL